MSLSRIEVITGMSNFQLKSSTQQSRCAGNDRDAGTWMRCGKGTREYEVDELEEMELLPNSRSILLWKRSV